MRTEAALDAFYSDRRLRTHWRWRAILPAIPFPLLAILPAVPFPLLETEISGLIGICTTSFHRRYTSFTPKKPAQNENENFSTKYQIKNPKLTASGAKTINSFRRKPRKEKGEINQSAKTGKTGGRQHRTPMGTPNMGSSKSISPKHVWCTGTHDSRCPPFPWGLGPRWTPIGGVHRVKKRSLLCAFRAVSCMQG